MDMEKLRKINDLANTLREKGLTTSRCEAAHIAGNLAGTHEEQEFSNNIEFKMGEDSPLRDVAKVKENKIEQAINKQEQKNYVDEKRLINILQEFTKVFEKKNEEMANELKATINKQQERINELSNALKMVSKKAEEARTNATPAPQTVAPSMPVASVPAEEDSLVAEMLGEVAPQPAPQSIPTPAPEPVSTHAPQPIAPAQPEKKKSQAPRSGGYDSDDVDVQKFFYFGGK